MARPKVDLLQGTLDLLTLKTVGGGAGATQTEARFFFMDESQVVRFNLGGAATSGSTAIGN